MTDIQFKNTRFDPDLIEFHEIAAIVINMNLWTRLKLAQDATPTAQGNRTP